MLRNFVIVFAILGALNLKAAAAENKSVHHIIAIHGIGGNHGGFGFLKEAISQQFAKAKLANEFTFDYFDYNVYDNVKSIHDFSSELDEFIIDKVGFKSQDKLSIIAYSEGSLVFIDWLVKNLRNEKSPIIDRIESVATIASPFWGADIANFAMRLHKSFGLLWILKGFGKQQLTDMSFGSDMVFKRMNLFSDPVLKEKFSNFTNKVRWIQLNGAYQPSKYNIPFFKSEILVENDMAVTVSSGTFNYLVYDGPFQEVIEPKKVFEDGQLSISNYVLEGIHLPGIDRIVGTKAAKLIRWPFVSLSDVPQKCINLEPFDCISPTYYRVLDNILDRPAKPSTNPNLTQFIIYFEIPIKKVSFEKTDYSYLIMNNENDFKTVTQVANDQSISENKVVRRYGFIVSALNSKPKPVQFKYVDQLNQVVEFSVIPTIGSTHFIKLR